MACLDNSASTASAEGMTKYAAGALTDPDPEVSYIVASDPLACGGGKDVALSLLRNAVITGHYCAYEGLTNDSLFASLRGVPEFDQVKAAAKQCQADFLTQRSRAAR
jgi:hypothetical protein